MTSPHVTLELLDHALVVHLDDGKANALSTEVIADLTKAVDLAENDESIAAIVLHGREGKFCAGFDLNVMRGGDLQAMSRLVCDGGVLVRRLYGSGIPLVAACTGHALAAGALVLLGCDVRIGADVECKIGLNEVAIGMVLPDWAMTIASARLNPGYLQRAVANARVTAAHEAVRVGFLDEAVDADQVLPRAIECANEMVGLNRKAYAGTLRSLRGPTLKLMGEQIAADRAFGNVPTA